MRLADRIRIESPDLLGDIPVIAADEVAAQIDQLPGDTWGYSPPASAYGVVAPPFIRFFVEAETAVDLADAGGKGNQVIQRGAIIEAHDGGDSDGYHWMYVIQPFIWYQPVSGSAIVGLHTVNGRILLHLDDGGHIMDDLDAVSTAVHDRSPLTADKMRSYVSFLPFILKALSVLHQRTVVKQVTHSRQVRRQHERKYGRPLANYYWLTVQPSPAAQSMSDVAKPIVAQSKREHIVRGHFRYYSPERPLFGRYSGMVWIPEHRRGEPDEESIHKDYMILP